MQHKVSNLEPVEVSAIKYVADFKLFCNVYSQFREFFKFASDLFDQLIASSKSNSDQYNQLRVLSKAFSSLYEQAIEFYKPSREFSSYFSSLTELSNKRSFLVIIRAKLTIIDSMLYIKTISLAVVLYDWSNSVSISCVND